MIEITIKYYNKNNLTRKKLTILFSKTPFKLFLC